MKEHLAIAYEDETLLAEAEILSQKLNLPLNNQSPEQLWLGHERLELRIPPFSPMFADFNYQRWQKRREDGKKQGLVRACKPRPGLFILDATAGWGRDAAVLASFGAHVLMCERNPIMAELLQDALKRQDEHSQKALPLSFQHQEAKAYLQSLKEEAYPDVIYIDPMHPMRQKSALVKKDLQILQQFIGTDEDALELIQLARQRAKLRVVVKWPQQTAALIEPDASIPGKTVRFDLYL
jgi:16S rRNA (guanine1516-N2)-methyltransferase